MKQFRCGDVVPGCQWVARNEDEQRLFEDIHTHARRGISQVPTAPNYARQGVTTVMEGPDGSSPVPLAPFLAELSSLCLAAKHVT